MTHTGWLEDQMDPLDPGTKWLTLHYTLRVTELLILDSESLNLRMLGYNSKFLGRSWEG